MTNSGLDVAEAVKEEELPSKVVILTTFVRQSYFERAIYAGIHGYLLKDSPAEELATALYRIHRGQKVIIPISP